MNVPNNKLLRAAAVTIALLGAGFGAWCLLAPRRLPNVILISIDTLRADHLGCYGYARETSPNVDRLARDGVLFQNAYSSTCWTAPSHMTLFTALYPSVHKVNQHPVPASLSEDIKTLPQYLKEAGYQCIGLYYGQYLAPELGFGKGFDIYEKKDFIAHSYEEAFKVLDGRKDKERPFFLFFHVGDVHAPYMDINKETQKKPKYRDMFDPGYKGAITTGNEKEALAVSQKIWVGKDVSRDLYHFKALYDGAIRHTDDYLGLLFQGLKDRGLYDKTMIVFVSDHGEEFGDHGIVGHNQLFRELIHVPLIIKLPEGGWRVRGPKNGKTYGERVRLMDLMPTVLDYLHIPFKAFHQGVSFLPLMKGKRYGEPTVYTESEMKSGPYESHRAVLDSACQFMRDSIPFQSVKAPVRHRLYDLKKDPGETEDLAFALPAVTAGYDKDLDRWTLEMAGARPKATKDTGEPRKAKMSKEQMEWLRSLGYLH